MGRHSVISIRRSDRDAAATAERIRAAAGEFRAARDCRRKAKDCELLWDAGRASAIEHVAELAAVGDRRFRGRSDRELTLIGAMRWSQSTEAQRLRRREERYTKRAMLDLAFARFLMHLHELADEPYPTDGQPER